MKVARLEPLYCDAGWRPWIFLKATTDDGAVGWAEITPDLQWEDDDR